MIKELAPVADITIKLAAYAAKRVCRHRLTDKSMRCANDRSKECRI
ncbi:hypothetical protein QW180_08090 [Vibrio sinaloensis]|nr:hypothetical protein [Vibrio sinaloensis]